MQQLNHSVRPESEQVKMMTSEVHRPESDDLRTVDEAAARLRTPPATLRYWRYMGTGPRSCKIGRRVLYRVADLDAWLDEQFSADTGGAA